MFLSYLQSTSHHVCALHINVPTSKLGVGSACKLQQLDAIQCHMKLVPFTFPIDGLRA